MTATPSRPIDDYARQSTSPIGQWSVVRGTLIVIYGLRITPSGWQYALHIWAYALAWGVFNDIAKKGAFRLLRKEGLYA
jgi:hypothetical protein